MVDSRARRYIKRTAQRLPPMDTESTDKQYDNSCVFVIRFESISFFIVFLSVFIGGNLLISSRYV